MLSPALLFGNYVIRVGSGKPQVWTIQHSTA
jgi:hypothetical protein